MGHRARNLFRLVSVTEKILADIADKGKKSFSYKFDIPQHCTGAGANAMAAAAVIGGRGGALATAIVAPTKAAPRVVHKAKMDKNEIKLHKKDSTNEIPANRAPETQENDLDFGCRLPAAQKNLYVTVNLAQAHLPAKTSHNHR